MKNLCQSMVALVAISLVASCTDTNLYSPAKPRKEASRVAVSGRVCSEDPVEARFPVKVVMLIDQAPGPLYSTFDPASQRVTMMQDFLQGALNNEQIEFAIVGYAGAPRKLAPQEGNFTRNPGELFAAITATSLQQPCTSGDQCRDFRDAIRTARALIEGDIAQSPDGLRVLTQYVIVHVNAGAHQPQALAADCCQPDDTVCIDAGDIPSPVCDGQLSVQEVASLREQTRAQGAAGLRYHVIHMAAEIGPDLPINDAVQANMEQMAFAGGGIYQRFNNIGGMSSRTFELTNIRTVLSAKLLMAANLNAKPGPDGPVVDTDADGLSDAEEEVIGTLPGKRDTDDDGVSDLVETLAGFDPLVVEDPPPTACANLEIGNDEDNDGLLDCDEALLGTSPTLVDSDGDGMPDILEVYSGTDYVNRDAEADIDGDGVNNGDEILQHSDPRSTDTRQHLSFGYRYEVEDEGFTRELFAQSPDRITGVNFIALSDGTTPGVGTLRYEAGTLRWHDADDAMPGPPVNVTEGGEFRLTSSSFAPIQGEDGKYVTVTVEPGQLPVEADVESIRVIFRDRQCLTYTIRNIQLMTTGALVTDPDDPFAEPEDSGLNTILVYLAQGPEERPKDPGPFRTYELRVRYNPPNSRDPDDAVVLVRDDEFTRPKIDP